MKKRNMKLPKRLLSMSLALSMCVGMACTTAFADDAEDYVYVYVGVDVVDTTEPETPDFSFKVTEEQKQELEELHNNVLNSRRFLRASMSSTPRMPFRKLLTRQQKR